MSSFTAEEIHYSAERKGPRKLSRIRPEIFDFEPDGGLKLGQTKPKGIQTLSKGRTGIIVNIFVFVKPVPGADICAPGPSGRNDTKRDASGKLAEIELTYG